MDQSSYLFTLLALFHFKIMLRKKESIDASITEILLFF